MNEGIGCYTFTCHKCGCMTPSHFPMPEEDHAGPVVLENDCFHCDEPLKKEFASVAELEAAIAD